MTNDRRVTRGRSVSSIPWRLPRAARSELPLCPDPWLSRKRWMRSPDQTWPKADTDAPRLLKSKAATVVARADHTRTLPSVLFSSTLLRWRRVQKTHGLCRDGINCNATRAILWPAGAGYLAERQERRKALRDTNAPVGAGPGKRGLGPARANADIVRVPGSRVLLSSVPARMRPT
jgi:hypothetical protein